MTRPKLPINIETGFKISIGDFSEIKENETNYNPIELSRNDLYDTFEPEIINGCCCTTPTMWKTCYFNTTQNILSNDPKIEIPFNSGCSYYGCFYLDSTIDTFPSTLSNFSININLSPDIFISPPEEGREKILFEIYLTFNDTIHFYFVMDTSTNTESISLNYNGTYWILTTSSSHIFLPINNIVYTNPIYQELNQISIYGYEAELNNESPWVSTDIGGFSGSYNGFYSFDTSPIFDFIGTKI